MTSEEFCVAIMEAEDSVKRNAIGRQVEAELDQLRADADRYRKLRPLLFLMDIPNQTDKVLEIHARQVSCCTDSIDAAVDALPD